jgi:Fe2+ transport system protein B
LQAVVYHEVGHWRDPVVWLPFLVIPVMLLVLYGNWRVTFRFAGSNVELVDYQDYH